MTNCDFFTNLNVLVKAIVYILNKSKYEHMVNFKSLMMYRTSTSGINYMHVIGRRGVHFEQGNVALHVTLPVIGKRDVH